jgi:hypothetical protein
MWNKFTNHQCLPVVDCVPDECNTIHGILPTNNQRKRVCFNLETNQVQFIAGCTDAIKGSVASIDLWWSSEEMNSSHRDGKLDALVKESAHEYCRAFERARRQVHTVHKLTTANLADLVRGLALGYRGLEHCSAVAATQRKLAVRDHVLSLVQCHRDSKSGALSKCLDDSSKHSCSSSRSGSTVDTANSTRHVHLECTVRNQSTKLSAGNRHFAVALGWAEHLAASVEDDKDPTRPWIK